MKKGSLLEDLDLDHIKYIDWAHTAKWGLILLVLGPSALIVVFGMIGSDNPLFQLVGAVILGAGIAVFGIVSYSWKRAFWRGKV